MFDIQYEKVWSKTTCLLMAQNLRKMADRFDYQADQLDQLRNYIPIEKHDLTPVLKVVNFILKQPNHAAKKNVLIREYSSIYNLDSVQVDRLYEIQVQRLRRESIENKKRTALIMHSKGKKSKEIARALALTPARISQIISKHKKAMTF
ncbi:MAG: hypothetical protein COB56_01035 [Robiginitomaculum sp.]|nr:MAG: hypothetical protein COB56_01035 [Robiginitomaculum sp.]